MTSTMIAGRLDLQARHFEVTEVPIPQPGPDEVRIAVAAAGVCLSDLHLIDGTLNPRGGPASVTLGHEVAGTVDAIGSAVPSTVQEGQRVTLQAGQSCGRCDNCVRRRPCAQPLTRGVHYDGGWAEYALARVDTLVPIPDHVPFDQAAIIPDAVSTPYAAIVTTAQVRPAQSAGVWGVGGLGAHGVQLLRLVGAVPIIAIDPLPAARERALTFGADLALDPRADDFPEQVRAATGGRGLDHAFDFAGVATAREQATAVLAPSGALVLVGLTPEAITVAGSTAFCARKNRLLGHYGSGPQHVEELVAMATGRRLDFARSISAHVPLADAGDAVHRLANKVGDPIRIVLVP